MPEITKEIEKDISRLGNPITESLFEIGSLPYLKRATTSLKKTEECL